MKDAGGKSPLEGKTEQREKEKGKENKVDEVDRDSDDSVEGIQLTENPSMRNKQLFPSSFIDRH